MLENSTVHEQYELAVEDGAAQPRGIGESRKRSHQRRGIQKSPKAKGVLAPGTSSVRTQDPSRTRHLTQKRAYDFETSPVNQAHEKVNE
ncbi:unnamed protein product, partial [Amoebophrya sp. A120]|eukprot:GSA120T00011528001.1